MVLLVLADPSDDDRRRLEPLDLQQDVGIGKCVGQLAADETCDFEIQCARVCPGSRKLLLLGRPSYQRCDAHLHSFCFHGFLPNDLHHPSCARSRFVRGNCLCSVCSHAAVEKVLEILTKDAPRLVKAHGGGLERSAFPPLRRREEDLHVYLKHNYSPIVAAYQEAATYVSLASLFLRRRTRYDTMIFGSVSEQLVNGRRALTSEPGWTLTAHMVECAAQKGWRRLVIAPGMVVMPYAQEYADQVQLDEKPMMVILKRNDILTALSEVFVE